MNINKVKAIVAAIVAADVVRIIEGANREPTVIQNLVTYDEVRGDPNNEALYFGWKGVGAEVGLDFSLKFTEGNIDLCTMKADAGASASTSTTALKKSGFALT